MAEKYFVLGSNSFSGASFVDYALEQGAQVIGASRSKEPSSAFLPYKNNRNLSHFKFARLDLNEDLDAILSEIEDFRPDYVVNFAAQSMVAESWQHPEHWFMTNVVSNVKFHDRLRKVSFLKKYVHVSTPEVYGTCHGNIREDAPYNPSTPYAVSRAACDMSLLSFFKNYSFPVVFTRAANVYGPGQQLYRIIPRTMLYIRLGKKLQLHGGGHSVRSFIHIRDVSDGTWKIARDAAPGEIFHLSTPVQISVRQLVELICSKMGARFEDVVDVVGERPGKDAAYLLDSTKAKTQLGWKDQIDLEAGLDQTLSWLDNNLEEIKKSPLDYIHKP